MLLELTDVTHYYGRVCALRDVSLAVPPGAIGLVGQNGAGKSTLMQILLGLIRPTSGDARVLGLPVKSSGIELRGRIGYMPERETLVPGLHGIEYAALAGELYGMSRKQALRRSHETLSYLGLEDARYRKVETYSVGMKQRLKLAASLVHDPDLLLLDEPTSGLDPDGRQAMLALLGVLAARTGKSLILSSHLLGDIERICQTAIILDRGQVLRVGSLAELKAPPTRSFLLRWKGEPAAFLKTLRDWGLAPRCDGRAAEALVEVDAAWDTRRFFAAAADHQLALTGLEPQEENLESVYHRLIGPAAGGSRHGA
ncbi:MAG: ABC transporter ATP-binding protein [Pirellulaceae bacterium]|nr:ABC transporter ATP-binding protein [Pirellulaceae bacterium]